MGVNTRANSQFHTVATTARTAFHTADAAFLNAVKPRTNVTVSHE